MNKRLLLVYISLGIIVATITGWSLYQKKVEYRNRVSRDAFKTAIMQVFDKERTKHQFQVIEGAIDESGSDTIGKKDISVRVISERGEKYFKIPYEKYRNNIVDHFEMKAIHSYLLLFKPLNPDSLNASWHNLLLKKNLSEKTIVRISYFNWDEQMSNTTSSDSVSISKSDSLVTYYLGYRYEVGATGFIYSPWWTYFKLNDIILLLALVVGCSLLFFIHGYIHKLYCIFFVKEKQVSVIVEKEVPVIIADKSISHTYQLANDIFFDIDSKILRNGDNIITLSPLPAKLLKGFLDSEGYILTNSEIMNLLWPDNTGTSDKLHTNIKRLRVYLSECPGLGIANENSSYRLLNSHFIE